MATDAIDAIRDEASCPKRLPDNPVCKVENWDEEHAMPGAMRSGIFRAAAHYETVLNFNIPFQPDDTDDARMRFGITSFDREPPNGNPNAPAYAYTPDDEDELLDQRNWISGDIFRPQLAILQAVMVCT